MEPRDWTQAEMYVIEKLKELQHGQDELLESVRCLDRKFASLSTEVRLKSGIWGALAGLLAALGFKLLR